eukprot:365447-Chlamydomonas_euryale.AAC.24
MLATLPLIPRGMLQTHSLVAKRLRQTQGLPVARPSPHARPSCRAAFATRKAFLTRSLRHTQGLPNARPSPHARPSCRAAFATRKASLQPGVGRQLPAVVSLEFQRQPSNLFETSN